MAEYVEKQIAKDDEAILKASRDGLKTCIDDESELRAKMVDDLRFACLDQWPGDLRAQRENDVVNGPRPCLTIDQINQYITQVSNDMAANRPSIKTRPVDDEADPETAEIFQGLIRHIEDQSSAHIAYSTSGNSAVTIGLGYLRVVSERTDPRSWDQDLFIRPIADTFCVYLSAHTMPDGSDADKGWIFTKLPMEKFRREYPNAKCEASDFNDLGVTPVWRTDDEVTICEYFYKEYLNRHLVYTADGQSLYQEEYDALPEPRPAISDERDTQEVKIKWCKHTGCEVIDKRDLPGKYIPIIEEVGKEQMVDGKRQLWGLVRPAKDSLRAFNYWVSALTEKMALAPKAPFIGAVGQFATDAAHWNKANVNNYTRLEYDAIDVNGNVVPAPRRQEPMQMEPAMAHMLSMMQNNVKSSLGMYKASIGDTESQQSGRAILALKKESDTGTSHFGYNQSISITHVGRILVDLIPHYYDTKRILRILGEDGKAASAAIDPELADNTGAPLAKKEIRMADGKIKRIYRLDVGKYDVTVSTGPGYTTSRQEAATVMTELANSAKDPVSAAVLRYLAVKSSDFHGSEEALKMLKATLPPQAMPPEDGQEPIPPQAMQKIIQLTQAAQGMQAKLQEVGQENVQLKSGVIESRAKIEADNKEAQAKLAAKHQETMAELKLKEIAQNEEIRLQREKAEAEIALKKWLAEQEIALKKGVAATDAQIETRAMEHSQLLEKLESISNLLKQFEVVAQKENHGLSESV